MADIKTILRELSVILGYILAKYKLEFAEDFINVKTYVDFIKKYCKNVDEDNSEIKKIEEIPDLTIHKDIIENGLLLGKLLFEKVKLDGDIFWLGSKVHLKYPFDIKIGNVGISLKENSLILKNPSFSSYLNALVQPKIPFKEVHIFRKFAQEEFNAWFDYAFNKLKETTNDSHENEIIFKYEKRGTYIKKSTKGFIFGKQNKEILIDDENIDEVSLNKRLGGYIFEHTFSKWLKRTLEKNDSEYQMLKKNCSEKAGSNLKEYIENDFNLDKNKFLELLQIYDQNYYFGKSFGTPMLYKVPTNLECKVELRKIEIKVPNSQLNVYFTFNISNINGTNNFEFKVECRYSHGQFKGIPEAKLYYTDNINHLKHIYQEIN